MNNHPSKRASAILIALMAIGVTACDDDSQPPTASLIPNGEVRDAAQQFPVIQLPPGYQIEKVVGGLSYPSSLTWDDQGKLYVVESGSGLTPDQLAPPRILRVANGAATEVVNLDGKVNTAVVGIVWHKGAFYITHRSIADRTDAVSRVTLGGGVTQLFSGIIDGQAEHQINDIKVGPDGRMYVTAGLAGNAGVMSNELMGFIKLSPTAHATPCREIVLTGQNFQTPDFRTPDPNDSVLTGAFVPYGTETRPGQVIPASRNRCGGSILSFDPDNADATLSTYAWGFRNIIGIAWNRATGAMYTATNGYDIRGARPVNDEFDGIYRVQQDAWYGVPDYSAALEPLTDDKFEPPDATQAPVFLGRAPIGKDLGFVINHAASGLTVASKSLIAGLVPVNASPSMLDVAPPSWGEFAGHLFVADFGDLAPASNPLRREHVGFRISRVDPATRQVDAFVRNAGPGPASEQGAAGQGIERPFDVEFGPDGAMYIVDYGVVIVDLSRVAQGKAPYIEVPGTGAIWRVSRSTARAYQVTIQNLTTGQPFSPGVIVTHTKQAVVWRLGAKASEGIRLIAEDGDPAVAVAELTATPGVHAVVNTTDPIHRIGGPGPTSRTFTIEAGESVHRLSVAVMLICTNDGFTGLDDLELPEGFEPKSRDVAGYDAGTEQNNQLTRHIVDPCGAIGPLPLPADGNLRRATADVIALHPGIVQREDLRPTLHGWTNPVARITVQRIR
ncbi:MAG: spondin domain-containing protein [Gemmatimonadaceae bacterium]